VVLVAVGEKNDVIAVKAMVEIAAAGWLLYSCNIKF
jgi:hypothetical protein